MKTTPPPASPPETIQLSVGPHIYTIELTLPALLARYSSASLKDMARIISTQKTGSKESFAAIVCAHISDPAQRLADYRALSVEERLHLTLLIAAPERAMSHGRARLLGQAAGLPGEKTLSTLLRRGFVLAVDPRTMIDLGRTDHLLLVAPGLPPLPSPPSIPLKLPVLNEGQLKAIRRSDPARLGQLLRALLEHASRSRLRVNKDNWMSAAHVGPLARALGLESPDAPIPLAFLLDIAVQNQLILLNEDHIRPAPDAMVRLQQAPHLLMGELFATFSTQGLWTDDAPPAEPRDLYDQLRTHSFGNPSPTDQRETRALVHAMLARLPENGWVSVDALCAEVIRINPKVLWSYQGYSHPFFMYASQAYAKEELPDDKRNRQKTFLMAYLLRTCTAFGILDVGSLDGEFLLPSKSLIPPVVRSPGPSAPLPPSQMAIRLSSLGRIVLKNATPTEQKTRLTVGPDFEIVVPLDQVSPQALYLLGQIAERAPGHPDDPVARYTLRRERWARTLQSHPEPPQKILALLLEWNGRPLPANVDRALREWSHSIEQIQLIDQADLLEFEATAGRDAFLAQNPQACAVGDRFALSSASDTLSTGKDNVVVLDYTQPPTRCLTLHLDGAIDILPKMQDFLVEAELSPFTEGAPGALRRKLTPASVKGWKSAIILERLSRRAALPKGLDAAIRGWCGEIPAAPLTRPLLLQIDPTVAEGALHHPDFAASIERALAPGVLVVKDLRALKKALQRLNIGTKESPQPK